MKDDSYGNDFAGAETVKEKERILIPSAHDVMFAQPSSNYLCQFCG